MKRKWIDLFLFYSTLMIIISGVVLYIMPHGRVAYFTGWKFLGLDKDAWDNLHVIFGFLMVAVATWHIIINWKPLKRYLLEKESFIALVIVFIVAFGSAKNIYPFKFISDLEEMIKNSWEVNKISVPIPHAELLTLKEFCKKMGIDYEKAKEVLSKRGINFLENETLKEIAIKNNTTPAKIYEMIKNLQRKKTMFILGSGIGKMSLSEFCKKHNISIKEAIKKLRQKGINAKENETLREIAFKNNLTPLDIAQIIY